MALDLCNEVGDPKNFYFIYPAESPTGAYLDINNAVKRDNGRTPVCMLYLTHMVGQERAVDMMTNKKLRERHLFVLKMPNYQGKGFDAVVLRYSDVPLAVDPLSTIYAVSIALGFAESGIFGLFGLYLLFYGCSNQVGDKKTCQAASALLLLLAFILLGNSTYLFTKRKERSRSREFESNLMEFKARTWQETESRNIEASETPNTVAAGGYVKRFEHKSRKSRKSLKSKKSRIAHMHRRNENEFRRLRSQSLEATVAGAAAPRTYRTR